MDRKTFIYTLTHSPCLSSNSPLILVYELLQDYFILDDYINDFDLIFEIFEHITCGHVPPLVSHLLVASRLLTLEKKSEAFDPLWLEMWFITCTLTIQFKNTFVEHFSQNQFGVATPNGCETFMGLKLCCIYIHSGWYYKWNVSNVFNIVF